MRDWHVVRRQGLKEKMLTTTDGVVNATTRITCLFFGINGKKKGEALTPRGSRNLSSTKELLWLGFLCQGQGLRQCPSIKQKTAREGLQKDSDAWSTGSRVQVRQKSLQLESDSGQERSTPWASVM
jgi:hypothetical protein